jgi:hypothetical protein
MMIREMVIEPYRVETDNYIQLDSFHHTYDAYVLSNVSVGHVEAPVRCANGIAPKTEFMVREDYGFVQTSAQPLSGLDRLPERTTEQLKDLLTQGKKNRFMYYTLGIKDIYVEDGQLKLFPTEEFSFDRGVKRQEEPNGLAQSTKRQEEPNGLAQSTKRQSARLSQVSPIYQQQTTLPRYPEYEDGPSFTRFPMDYSYFNYQQTITSGFYLGTHIDYYFVYTSLLLHPLYYPDLEVGSAGPEMSPIMLKRAEERRGYTDPATVFYVLRGEPLFKSVI